MFDDFVTYISYGSFDNLENNETITFLFESLRRGIINPMTYILCAGTECGRPVDSLKKDWHYSKTCLKRPLKRKPEIGFHDRLSLNAGQKYCRMHQESIMQYFRPSFSYHLSLRPLFCLFLSGCLRQLLLNK